LILNEQNFPKRGDKRPESKHGRPESSKFGVAKKEQDSSENYPQI
jgi:hypothetical protein